jgi:hypothetical protein
MVLYGFCLLEISIKSSIKLYIPIYIAEFAINEYSILIDYTGIIKHKCNRTNKNFLSAYRLY